jgi:hypothetical protein
LPEPAVTTETPAASETAATEQTLPPPAGFPLVLPYRDGVPIPRGYHVEHRPATGLIVVGSVTLSLSYVVALGLGVHNSFDGGYGWTVVPVAGPWGAIGARDFKCKVNSTDFDVNNPGSIDTGVTAAEAERCIKRAQTEAIDIAILAVDGMVQATGAALLLAGLASGVDELVWDGLKDVHVSVAPHPQGGGQIGIFGRF